jgi:hypothetical protein
LLETPIDDPGDDRRNVARLWELAGLNDVAPPAEKGFSMMTPSMKKLRAKLAKEGKKVGSSRDLPAVKVKTKRKKTAKKKR